MDPTGENDIPQHMYRQSMIISLFGSIVEPAEPSDARNLDILVDSVCICMYITEYNIITLPGWIRGEMYEMYPPGKLWTTTKVYPGKAVHNICA